MDELRALAEEREYVLAWVVDKIFVPPNDEFGSETSKCVSEPCRDIEPMVHRTRRDELPPMFVRHTVGVQWDLECRRKPLVSYDGNAWCNR